MWVRRAVGMVLFWLMSAVSGFCAFVGLRGFVSGSLSDGYPPLMLTFALLAGVPCIFIWRFMIR